MYDIILEVGTTFFFLVLRISSPNKVDLTSQQIERKFPAEHPYASHISRTNLYPSYDSPQAAYNEINRVPTLPAEAPASAPETTVLQKIKGSGARHEIVSLPLDSQRRPMTWPQGPTYFQVNHLPYWPFLRRPLMALIVVTRR